MTPEIILTSLFIFGMSFEAIISARPFPASWAWLDTVIRTGVILAGETFLIFDLLTFNQIFFFIWLPTLLIVGPRLAFRISRVVTGRKLSREDSRETERIFKNAP